MLGSGGPEGLSGIWSVEKKRSALGVETLPLGASRFPSQLRVPAPHCPPGPSCSACPWVRLYPEAPAVGGPEAARRE